MSSAVIRYSAAGLTDRGRKRSTNEDAFAIAAEQGLFVVCDGMGGAAAGEVASALAVDEVVKQFKARDAELPLPQGADQAVKSANQAIFDRAQRNPKLSGMGTTLVVLVVDGTSGWMLNVGDSRGYRLRDGKLEQITEDHSLVEEQLRSGRISALEAQLSPLRNVITRALGTQPAVTADVFPVEVEPGDLFLLCSDGLTREVPDDLLGSMLEADLPVGEICKRLVAAANEAGGQDNITCVVVRAEA